MTAHLVNGDTFTALTVGDPAGATLNVERTDDGHLSAWIAPPGGSDGHSVVIDEADSISLSAYLTVGFLAPDLAAQLEAANAMCDELRERDEKLTAVAEAGADVVSAWLDGGKDIGACEGRLREAVDALPNMQEPCDVCAGRGCPDCQEPNPRTWSAVPQPDVKAVRGTASGRVWVRSDYTKAPSAWWMGEPGVGMPRTWSELLAAEGTVTEVTDAAVNV